MKVICVYRTGGDYFPEYVLRLKQAVDSKISAANDFVCLTDDPEVSDICDTIPLKHEWPGWWSKIELFRPDLPHEPMLYLDLDTLVLKNINALAKLVDKFEFMMLRGFHPKFESIGGHPASGIMAGKFWIHSKVYYEFKRNSQFILDSLRGKGAGMSGDQGWISQIIPWSIPKLQDYLPEYYIIGKRILKVGGRPVRDAHLLAWTGTPRIHVNKELAPIWKRYEDIDNRE